MIKVFIYSCLLLVFLINCKSNIPEARNKTDYSQITHYSSRSAHPISSVNFDTIRIDAGNENEMTSLRRDVFFFWELIMMKIFLTSGPAKQSCQKNAIGKLIAVVWNQTDMNWVPAFLKSRVAARLISGHIPMMDTTEMAITR